MADDVAQPLVAGLADASSVDAYWSRVSNRTVPPSFMYSSTLRERGVAKASAAPASIGQ